MLARAPTRKKLTPTVKIELDGAGNIRNREFMKSVIKSNRRMTYLEVAEILKGGIIASEYEDVKDMLFACKELAGVLRRKRSTPRAPLTSFRMKPKSFLIRTAGC